MSAGPTFQEGGCLCGAVRYRLHAAPLAVRQCWCRDCQHLAANGTVNALLPSEALEVSGTPRAHERRADSGHTVTRSFCPDCGSHLFAQSSGRPGITVVRVGTLDDPSSVRPSTHVWAGSAPAWACLDPALERIAAQAAAPPRAG